jgi:pimeloyl-ACP methyl ester carboxylesterase
MRCDLQVISLAGPTRPFAICARENFRRLMWGLGLVLITHLSIATTPPLSHTDESDELALIFRPFETNGMTLSPDGRYLAYTERKGDDLYLDIRDLEANTIVRQLVGIAETIEGSGAREKKPAELTFMRWAAEDWLVFSINGENIWSIRGDGTNAKRLGDSRNYAAGLPPNTTVSVASQGFGVEGGEESGFAIVPPSALEAAHDVHQPVNIAAMTRDDRYVYVEAQMHERGLVRDLVTNTAEPDSGGTPRVVERVEIKTGTRKEWAEAPESRFILCDQDGYPRIAAEKKLIRNSASVAMRFVYAAQNRNDWSLLDGLVKPETRLKFELQPESQLGERSVPLGFDYDSTILYFASNVGRDTYGIYTLNTRSWQRAEVAIESNVSDLIDPTASMPDRDALVFDVWKKKLVGVRYLGVERATLWLDPELQRTQKTVNAIDPRRRWEILEWDRLRRAYLVISTSQTDPGTYYVFYPEERRADEIMSRAPWLTTATRNPGISFGFQTKAGVNLSGYLTTPLRPILKRPPLVVLCHDGPWQRDLPGYNREAQALAAMGFIVLQVNYRGSAGFGRKHLDALREGYDSVAIDDILAAIDAITPKNVDRRLVAIMGHGYGGYLALRAMQLHPNRFRCAVTFDAPTDLPPWLNPPPDASPIDELRHAFDDDPSSNPIPFAPKTDDPSLDPGAQIRGPAPINGSIVGKMRRAFFGTDVARLEAISPLAHPDQIQSPVMIIESDTSRISHGAELASALKHAQREVTYVSLSKDQAADLPQARAALFRQIHEFLNVNIYNYAVKIGEVVEKK